MYGLNETVDVKLKFADVNKVYKINFEGLIPYFNEILKDKHILPIERFIKTLLKILFALNATAIDCTKRLCISKSITNISQKSQIMICNLY